MTRNIYKTIILILLLLPTCSFAEQVVISNAPETITSGGILYQLNNFSGKARLIIHHKNMQFTDITEEGNQFSLIITPVNKQANVILVGGKDTSRSGYVAGVNSTNKYLELTQAMPPSHLTTGESINNKLLITKPVKILLGTAHRYEVFSITGDIETDEPINIQVIFGRASYLAQGRSHHIAGIYRYNITAYDIKKDTTVSLGMSPYLTDPITGHTNKGNYGITTKLKLSMSFKERKLTISARGGRAYVVLHIRSCLDTPEGSWVIVDLQAYESATYVLSKGEMTITTYPIPGSAYPVRLQFKEN